MGVPLRSPVLAGLGKGGRGEEEGPCLALLLWQGTVFVVNNVMLW